MSKRVLFIHHGTHAGGAPLSLLYTAIGVRNRGFTPLVGLVKPSEPLHSLYNKEGIETIEMPKVALFIIWSSAEMPIYDPRTLKSHFYSWKTWKAGQNQLFEKIEEYKIDLVHLNSMGFASLASELIKKSFPFVWHVREYGPKNHGRRYKYIQGLMKKAPAMIFLSSAEKKSWLGEKALGHIVHNFIDFKKFNPETDPSEIKNKLKLEGKSPVILYLGGIKPHKGITTLIKALAILKKTFPNLRCLMPDSQRKEVKQNWKTRLKKPVQILMGNRTTLSDEVDQLIDLNELNETCMRFPFNPYIVEMFALSDLVIFPAIKPHFARPIIEGQAMKKAVVASDLEPMNEIMVDGQTGFLAKPGDENDLASKMMTILSNDALKNQMGEAGHIFALKHFKFENQIDKIIKIYTEVIS